MTRFQFVADHSGTYQVKRLCDLVELERSSYYAWKSAEPDRAARVEADAQLAERIRVIHVEDNTYGAPRITAELNDGVAADEIDHKRVARVMRQNSIVGYRRRRHVTTTVPEPADQKVPDLLERDEGSPSQGNHLLVPRLQLTVAVWVDPHGDVAICPIGELRVHANR